MRNCILGSRQGRQMNTSRLLPTISVLLLALCHPHVCSSYKLTNNELQDNNAPYNYLQNFFDRLKSSNIEKVLADDEIPTVRPEEVGQNRLSNKLRSVIPARDAGNHNLLRQDRVKLIKKIYLNQLDLSSTRNNKLGRRSDSRVDTSIKNLPKMMCRGCSISLFDKPGPGLNYLITPKVIENVGSTDYEDASDYNKSVQNNENDENSVNHIETINSSSKTPQKIKLYDENWPHQVPNDSTQTKRQGASQNQEKSGTSGRQKSLDGLAARDSKKKRANQHYEAKALFPSLTSRLPPNARRKLYETPNQFIFGR